MRYSTGDADRHHWEDEAEFRSVFRIEFGLNMADEEFHTCIEVMERKGEKKAPQPSSHEWGDFSACYDPVLGRVGKSPGQSTWSWRTRRRKLWERLIL